MKIIILTNKLSFNLYNDVQNTINYFKNRLPFPLEFIYREVNISTDIKVYQTIQGFNTITGQPENIRYMGLQDYVKDNCRKFVKEGEAGCVIFAWSLDKFALKGDQVITSFTNYKPLYEKTEFIQLAINKYLKDTNKIWIRISHEIMHSLCYKISRNTNLSLDEMDNTKNGKRFYRNDDPEASNGNFALTLKNLEPYFSQLDELAAISSVVLTRSSDDGIQTLGTLKVGSFECYTLERPWRNNQKNISCIPKGKYLCKWTFSRRLLKFTYEITKVLDRDGIRFHSASFFTDIAGCISLGDSYADINSDKELDVLNSRRTIKTFEDIMQKKTFMLEIK